MIHQLDPFTYRKSSCTSQDQADPVNVIFEGSDVSSDEIFNTLQSHNTPLGQWGTGYGDLLYYPVPGLGKPPDKQVFSPPGFGGILERFHARLWNYSSDCVVCAAHHEYSLSLGGKPYGPIPLPVFKRPHTPTDFESGKWAIGDSFSTASGWQVFIDKVKLTPRQLVPAHNGCATRIVKR